MNDKREWVLLCECWSTAELHMVRASLEADGVPAQVQGDHAHGVLGMLQGQAVRPRILVPRGGLADARALAEEILGPFDEIAEEGVPDVGSPFRTEPQALAVPDERAIAVPGPRPKSLAVISVIAAVSWFMLPLNGAAHLYLGHNRRGGALILLTIFAYTAAFSGARWTLGLVALAGFADFVGGCVGVVLHNHAVAKQSPETNDDDDDDYDDDDDVGNTEDGDEDEDHHAPEPDDDESANPDANQRR